jgi:hypothetical protein
MAEPGSRASVSGKAVARIGPEPLSSIALYSAHVSFAPDEHAPSLEAAAKALGLRNATFKIVKQRNIGSKTEVDWSARTSNGTNGYYYVLARVERAAGR